MRLFMDWISIKDKQPEPYQEVIIASNEGRVKSAIYIGAGKWNTFLEIAYWMPMPKLPNGLSVVSVETPKKKRGRPKKV